MSTPKASPKRRYLIFDSQESPRSPTKNGSKINGSNNANSAVCSKTVSVSDIGSPIGPVRRTLWEPPQDLFPKVSTVNIDNTEPVVYFPCELTPNDYVRRVLDILAAEIQPKVLEITDRSVAEQSDGILSSLPVDDEGDIFSLLKHILGTKHALMGDSDDAQEVQLYVASKLNLLAEEGTGATAVSMSVSDGIGDANGVTAVKLRATGQALLDYKPKLGCKSVPLTVTDAIASFGLAKSLAELFGASTAAVVVPQLEALRAQFISHEAFKKKRSMALGLISATIEGPAVDTATVDPCGNKADASSCKDNSKTKAAESLEKMTKAVMEAQAAAAKAAADGGTGGGAANSVSAVIQRGETLIATMNALDGTPERALSLLLIRLKILRDEVAILLEKERSEKNYAKAQYYHDFTRNYLSPAIASAETASVKSTGGNDVAATGTGTVTDNGDSTVTSLATTGMTVGVGVPGEADALCAAASELIMSIRTEQSVAAAKGEFIGPDSASALEDLLTRLEKANNQLTSVDHEAPILLAPTTTVRCFGHSSACSAQGKDVKDGKVQVIADEHLYVTGRNLLALRHPIDGRSIIGLLVASNNRPLLDSITHLWVPGFGNVELEPEAAPESKTEPEVKIEAPGSGSGSRPQSAAQQGQVQDQDQDQNQGAWVDSEEVPSPPPSPVVAAAGGTGFVPTTPPPTPTGPVPAPASTKPPKMGALRRQLLANQKLKERRSMEARAKAVALSDSAPEALAKSLRSVGYSATELKIAGYTCKEVSGCGFSCKQVAQAGWRHEDLKAGNFSCSDFKQIDYSCKQVKALGFSCKDATEAGYSGKEICDAGYSCKDARRAGWSKLRDLRLAGYSCKSARDAGFTCLEAKDAGYFDPKDMKLAGFTCKEAREAGYGWNDCVIAGYSYESAVETGFPYSPTAGYSAAYWNDHYTKFVDQREEAKAAEMAKFG